MAGVTGGASQIFASRRLFDIPIGKYKLTDVRRHRTDDAPLDALGDPTRRAILARLREGPIAVGDLARAFPISRPAISQHLRILKEAKLVTDVPDGRRRVYQLDPAGFNSVREYLDEFWGVALIAFKHRIENNSSKEK